MQRKMLGIYILWCMYKWERFDDGQRMMVKNLLQFHVLGLNFFSGGGGGGVNFELEE